MSSALATQPEPKTVARAKRPLLTNNILLVSASVVLLLGPLAFGAVEPWAIFALQACAMLVFAAWGFRQWSNRELIIVDNPLYLPMTVFFALVLVQWVIGTTAYRLVTYTHLLLYAAYGMLAFVVSQTLRRSSQFELLAKIFTGYGAVVAALAVVQGMAPNGKLYWIVTAAQGGSIYGPYVNRNHYAGLMEMLVPFPLVLAASQFSSGNRKIIVAGIAALMAASIFLSGSRGGMAAFIAEIVVLSVLLVRKRDGSWRQPLMLGMFLALVVIFLVWMGGNALTQRLMSIHSEAREEINGGVRLTIDRDCLRMVLKKPLLGWGLGAFPIAYPAFRSFYTNFFVNQAHNDYLQLLVETGLAGFGIAVWFLVLMFRKAASKIGDWTDSATGALTVSALLGCVGILVHGFVDFNLQIPANAALFYVLCALVASGPLQESTRKKVVRRHNLIVQPVPETSEA